MKDDLKKLLFLETLKEPFRRIQRHHVASRTVIVHARTSPVPEDRIVYLE